MHHGPEPRDRSEQVAAGIPDHRELLLVVRDALSAEVLPVTSDRAAYVVRMACRLLDIAHRESMSREHQAGDFAARMQRLGADDESDLASMVLDGSLPIDDPELRSLVADLVEWRRSIAVPP